MRKALADLGRASPALSQTWRDIMSENRARRQEAAQGEDLTLRRAQFQQEKAVSDVQLKKAQLELEATQKREKWLDEPMDITTHSTFMGLSQETKNKVLQDFSTGKVTDDSGRGTRRDILNHIGMMEKTPQLLDSYLTVEMNARHNQVLKANEVLQKEIQKPDSNPQKVSQLQAEFDATNQRYTSLLKNRKDYLEAMEWKANIDATTDEIRRLQSEGKLGQMPEPIKQSMFMALRTGDLKSVNEMLKEWAKSEFKPTEPKKWPQTKEDVREYEKMKSEYRGQSEMDINKMFAQYNIARIKQKNDPLKMALAGILANQGVAISPEEDWPQLSKQEFQKYITTGVLPQRQEKKTTTSVREKAIQWLKDNNAPETDANIKAVIEKFGWK